MICQSCGHENAGGNLFCIKCGSPLTADVGELGNGAPVGGADDSPFSEELRRMNQIIARLADRVTALERLGEAPAPRATEQPSATLAVSPLAETAAAGPSTPVAPSALAPQAGAPASGSAAVSPMAPPPSPRGPVPLESASGPRFSVDWEQVLGLNWLAIIGAVALAIGAGFFLQQAFENNWIGETGRVVLGIVIGIGMLGIGEYAQRRIPAWAQAVTGGGISILYLSIYSAFGFFELIDPIPAMLFLALVVATSGLLALRYKSLVIALLGIFGAFLTPVLLGGDIRDDQRSALLAYILVVDIGILGVSTFRNWRWFTLIGLLASYLLFAQWTDQIAESDFLPAQAGLTGIFLIFVGATTLFHIIWRRAPQPTDRALMTLNAIAYFSLTYALLWDDYKIWFGLIALGLSLFFGLVGYAATRRSGAPREVALYSVAIALIFMTIAVPLQLSGSWITVAWATQGAVLVWVGFRLGSWQTRGHAFAVLAIAAGRLLFFDTPIGLDDFRPFVNDRFPTFAVSIAALYVVAYLYRRERDQLAEWEEHGMAIFIGVANLLTLWILSAEAISYFDSRELEARLAENTSGVRFFEIQDAQNGQYLALTAIWALYAFVLLGIAAAKRSRLFRWAGVALLSVSVAKLILWDTFNVKLNVLTFTLVLNFQFLTSLVVLAVMAFAVRLLWRQRADLLEGERPLVRALLVLANVVALWILSAEALRFFDSQEFTQRTDLTSAKHLTLTLMWTIYAIGIIIVGFVRRSVGLRLAGLGALGVPIVKLFVFDVFLLDQGYRVAAFVVLGVLLLVTGLTYQRFGKNIKELVLAESP